MGNCATIIEKFLFRTCVADLMELQFRLNVNEVVWIQVEDVAEYVAHAVNVEVHKWKT